MYKECFKLSNILKVTIKLYCLKLNPWVLNSKLKKNSINMTKTGISANLVLKNI